MDSPVHSRLQRPRVLIVDDEPDNVELFGLALANELEVQFATSGPEALALIARQAPDLILLDVMMPEMDGYQVLEEIRKLDRCRKIPVLFVTARDDPDSETRALAAGAVDYIHKPVNVDVLCARVRTQIYLLQRDRECRELNEFLERKVDERTLALRDALARAEAAAAAKSSFFANISHELRTPLNAVMGLSYLLGRELDGLPQQKARTDRIHAAGRQLLDLLSEVFDAAKLEAHRLNVEEVDFSLPQVVDSVVAGQRARAAAKGLSIEVVPIPGLDPTLRGDPLRIGQILGHYLDNAIKFSARGRIAIRLRLDNARSDSALLRIEVADEGCGIAPEIQAQLFAPFVQGDASTTREHGGSGLGLAICRQLAELLGGEAGLSSEPGRGSTFWATVRIGLVPAAVAGDPALEAARHTLAYLDRLLAESDVLARVVWQAQRGALAPLLGNAAPTIADAIDDFDFEAALVVMRTAVGGNPRLAGYRR
ncbi:MAG TPA: response regulator [Azospira sp.]|nr:response regulator [Azospira sp.]